MHVEKAGWFTEHPLRQEPVHVVTREWFEQVLAERNEAHAHAEEVGEAVAALLEAYDRSGLTDLHWFVPYMEAVRDAYGESE